MAPTLLAMLLSDYPLISWSSCLKGPLPLVVLAAHRLLTSHRNFPIWSDWNQSCLRSPAGEVQFRDGLDAHSVYSSRSLNTDGVHSGQGYYSSLQPFPLASPRENRSKLCLVIQLPFGHLPFKLGGLQSMSCC